MNVTLPYPPDRYDPASARQLVDQLTHLFDRVLSTESASSFALLMSPDGGAWRVTVSNTGVLTTVRLPLGQPL